MSEHRNCACFDTDARSCFELRYYDCSPAWQNDPAQSDGLSLPESCECACHYDRDEDRDEDSDGGWGQPIVILGEW